MNYLVRLHNLEMAVFGEVSLSKATIERIVHLEEKIFEAFDNHNIVKTRLENLEKVVFDDE